MAYTLIFLLKNVSSFCIAKATDIFSAKYLWFFLDFVITRTFNSLTTNELVKLTMFWTIGPWALVVHQLFTAPDKIMSIQTIVFFFFFFFFFFSFLHENIHCRYSFEVIPLTLLLLNTSCSVLANSVDPDQLASEEANWSGSTLSLNMKISIKNLDQVIWLVGN